MSVIKCPVCDKCFIGVDICPFCKSNDMFSDDTDLPDFMKDIFGTFQNKDRKED